MAEKSNISLKRDPQALNGYFKSAKSRYDLNKEMGFVEKSEFVH